MVTVTATAQPATPSTERPPPRRVALVHDFLLDLRGAERVFAVMCDLWPEADIFTALYDERGTEGRFAGRSVRTSFLQRAHPTASSFRPLLPFYPLATERLDLRGYDLVISSSSAWAHGVLVDEGAVHVCYCHNPFRYAWNERDATLAARRAPLRTALALTFDRWRAWDRRVARRVDRYIANSHTTQERIARYYGRESSVVYPPVATSRFSPGEVSDHFVLVSELVAHKRIDLAVRTFTRLGRRLVVVGDGPQERHLRQIAGPTVEFVGRVSDARLVELVRSSLGLVVTAVEEFGIAAVEAQAAGRPALVPDSGGGRDTVREGVTGSFYRSGDPGELARAVEAFHPERFDPVACVANAARFDTRHFRRGLVGAVADAWNEGPVAAAGRGETDSALGVSRAA